MFTTLSQRRSLWIALTCTLLLAFAFPVSQALLDILLLDPLSDPEQVRTAIGAMSTDQRHAHAWITATLDVAFPVAYGSLFVGSAIAFYPRIGPFLATGLSLVVPTDLLEGVVQVLALTGTADFVDAKAVLTPLKTILFLAGFFVMIFGWLRWAAARFRRA